MRVYIFFAFIIVAVTTEVHARKHRYGGDDDYLNGGFNPGKRCVNLWDEGCVNGQLNGAGGDDDYLNGGFNPGKRCVNLWDEGCVNGQLNGAGGDDDYLNGGFNPGKRALEAWLFKLQRPRPQN